MRYSDLGITEKYPPREAADGVESGVEGLGMSPNEEERREGEVDMLV